MPDQITTYLNPVYDRSFADPFVLKHCGEYWAYCTGFWQDGRCFGMLRSSDLVHWQELGGAMAPLPGDLPMYWAPEVSYHNGVFYLYYSVGTETLMEIRVATAEHPGGPFVDSGRRVTSEDFAIDAHVFEDEDGSRYLFYATDFLEHSHIGTGTVRDRLIDPYTLAGDPRPVTRARYDWQVYDPQRAEKGGVRWHTIEGSFVLKHKGRYYQMFSGGNWQNVSYGVSYALTSDLLSSDEWRQVADGEQVLPVIRTLPGVVIGPGHNSVVRGPDNQQLFCVYHRWAADGSGRVMAIDRLDWVGERMVVLGPSITPQPIPNAPSLAGFGHGWCWDGGVWAGADGGLEQRDSAALASASRPLEWPDCTVELSLRLLEMADDAGAFGVALAGADGVALSFSLQPARQQALVTLAGTDEPQVLALRPDFNATAYHLLRLEVNAGTVSIMLDDIAWRWQAMLAGPPERIALHTQGAAAAFAGFELTYGFRDLFTQPWGMIHATRPQVPAEELQKRGDPVASAAPGWQMTGAQSTLSWRDQQLFWRSPGADPARLSKAGPFGAAEVVITIRLVERLGPVGGYGFGLLDINDSLILHLSLEVVEAAWAISWSAGAESQRLVLPPAFDPTEYQQFRLRQTADQITLAWEAAELGAIACAQRPAWLFVAVQQAEVAFDEVRVTQLVPGSPDY